MGFTSQLQKQVDLPVWEWLRFSPNASAAGGTFTFPETKLGRYIYGFPSSTNFQRYDTQTDGWGLLTSPITAWTSPTYLKYDSFHGFQGRAISATANTIQMASLFGNKLVGQTIRIIAGTGAGQTRVITSVADAVIADTMVASAITVNSITDATKAYLINQWRDYSIRTYNASAALPSIYRRILYSNATSVTWADLNWQTAGIEPHCDLEAPAVGSSTAGSATIMNIESSVVTVNSPWTIIPDSSSRYAILGGNIWLVSAGTQFTLQHYDILSDAWGRKSSPAGGLLTATLGTDVVLEHTHEGYNISNMWSGNGVGYQSGNYYGYATGNATAGNISGIFDSTQTWSGNQWKNFKVRITSGTAAGQERTILSNTSTGIITLQNWNNSPDNTSAYSIIGDSDKLWMMVGGAISSSLYQYSHDADMWSPSRIYDWGTVNALGCIPVGTGNTGIPSYLGTFAISSITTGASSVATVTTALNHPLKVGDYFNSYGATLPSYNVTTGIVTTVPSATTFTYTVTGSPASPAVAANAQSTTILVDSSNSWITNQFVGKLLVSITTAGSNLQTYQIGKITANTPTTITVSAAQTSLTNGTMKYLICDNSVFGALSAGICSAGGSTTLITDTTQNWTSNYNSRRVRILSGGGAPSETTITSNTTTALNITAIAAATTAATTYAILGEPQVPSSGMKLLYIWNNTFPNSNGLSAGWYLMAIFGNSTMAMARFNLTTELWEEMEPHPMDFTAANSDLMGAGTMAAYDGGNRVYFTINSTGRVYAYDWSTGSVDIAGNIPYGMSTAIIGNRMEIVQTAQGLKFLYVQRHTGTEWWRTLLYW